MPHDPSTCPRCRWTAGREGWEYSENGWPHPNYPGDEVAEAAFAEGKGAAFPWRKGNRYAEGPPTFCTSLDAVAGLRRELNEGAERNVWWMHGWDARLDCWIYVRLLWVEAQARITERYYSDEDLPSQCVIRAAMQVLGDKEIDA